MRKWTKAASLIFLAASSVYSDQVIAVSSAVAANTAKPANSASKAGTDVKVLEEGSDPFADAPTTAPTTKPAQNAIGSGSTSPLQNNADGTFSLSITNGADLVEQLRVIGFQAQRSILPSKDVRGTLAAMDLYNVTVKEALDAILQVNGYTYREKGNFIFVYTNKEMQEMEKAARVQTSEVFRLYYTPAANAVTMIKPVLSADSQVSVSTPALSGIESGTSDVGGNSHATEDVIVVTDYKENLDRIRALLKDIDRRPEQILIEATILSASLTEDNQLGVDFNIVGGVDFSTLTHSNGQLTGSDFPANAANGGTQRIATGGTGNSFSGPVNGGFRLGVVTNDISIFLSALEGVTDTTVLANPKVLALNKQKGEVIVGRKDGYITTTVSQTSSVQTVEFLDTGTRLIFRPFIGDDGYIRMEVHPEDSTGGLSAANLPFKVTTEVTGNIMVKDGHTVMIGGLFREQTDSTKSQVPFFGDLPIAGQLFRNQHDHTKREEIIILLTPHIIKDDSVYSAASQEMMRDAERLRVGVRHGLMPWGRERMAEWWFDRATTEMNKPNPNRGFAIWACDAATNLNPKYLEAIKLKEEVSGKQVVSSDNSSVRSFVSKQIMRDHGARSTTRRVMDDVSPTTAPVMAAIPATNPSLAVVPTTAPAVAIAPTTAQSVAVEPTTIPSEIVAVETTEVVPEIQPVVSGSWTWKTFGLTPSKMTDAILSATSQPSPVEAEHATTVTELPLDEAGK